MINNEITTSDGSRVFTDGGAVIIVDSLGYKFPFQCSR